ncbi:MAG: hypothetical protein ACUVUU_09825 [bacterium]
MAKRLIAFVLLSFCLLIKCAREEKVSVPKSLEPYIQLVVECIRIENIYANDPELFASELQNLGIPEDPRTLVEEMLTQHGRNPKMWYRVYQEILSRSRS